jgi:Flp pilus assembly protein CpaB
MHKRSNMLLGLGAAVFLIGAALVVSLVQSTSQNDSKPTTGAVLVARETIPAGTSGADAITKELVVPRNVPSDLRAADVLINPAELSGRVLDVQIDAGEQIRASALRPMTVRGGAINIPAGHQGVAIQMPFVSGGAGYIGPGDFIDIYGNVKQKDGEAFTQLLLGGVKVLDVSTEVAPRVVSGESSERIGSSNVTYLLALTADQAERVIYLAANQQLWLTLQGEGNPPVPSTPGRTSADVFK